MQENCNMWSFLPLWFLLFQLSYSLHPLPVSITGCFADIHVEERRGSLSRNPSCASMVGGGAMESSSLGLSLLYACTCWNLVFFLKFTYVLKCFQTYGTQGICSCFYFSISFSGRPDSVHFLCSFQSVSHHSSVPLLCFIDGDVLHSLQHLCLCPARLLPHCDASLEYWICYRALLF